jgi:hypothetical protein
MENEKCPTLAEKFCEKIGLEMHDDGGTFEGVKMTDREIADRFQKDDEYMTDELVAWVMGRPVAA